MVADGVACAANEQCLKFFLRDGDCVLKTFSEAVVLAPALEPIGNIKVVGLGNAPMVVVKSGMVNPSQMRVVCDLGCQAGLEMGPKVLKFWRHNIHVFARLIPGSDLQGMLVMWIAFERRAFGQIHGSALKPEAEL